MRKPWRLRWSDRIDADVTHVACGNGYSLIAIKDSKFLKGDHLFGSGINTQSQIGLFNFTFFLCFVLNIFCKN